MHSLQSSLSSRSRVCNGVSKSDSNDYSLGEISQSDDTEMRSKKISSEDGSVDNTFSSKEEIEYSTDKLKEEDAEEDTLRLSKDIANEFSKAIVLSAVSNFNKNPNRKMSDTRKFSSNRLKMADANLDSGCDSKSSDKPFFPLAMAQPPVVTRSGLSKSPDPTVKRPSFTNESTLKLLPEHDEVDFSCDSAMEEDWDGRRSSSVGDSDSLVGESVSRRASSGIGSSPSEPSSRRASSNIGDSESVGEESVSRRASSGIGSMDGRSALSRTQSIDEESSMDSGRSSSSSSDRRSVDSSSNQPHDPLARRDSLLEAVLAAKRSGWRNLIRSESIDSATSFASSLTSLNSQASLNSQISQSSLASQNSQISQNSFISQNSLTSVNSDASGCPCDDCLLGLTQPPTLKKVSLLMNSWYGWGKFFLFLDKDFCYLSKCFWSVQ